MSAVRLIRPTTVPPWSASQRLARTRPRHSKFNQNYPLKTSVFSGQKFKPYDYAGGEGNVVPINEAADPKLFSVFCVFSGKITALHHRSDWPTRQGELGMLDSSVTSRKALAC